MMAIPNKGMKAEAIKGLEWRKEFGRGGTRVGLTRANQIKNGVDFSTGGTSTCSILFNCR